MWIMDAREWKRSVAGGGGGGGGVCVEAGGGGVWGRENTEFIEAREVH